MIQRFECSVIIKSELQPVAIATQLIVQIFLNTKPQEDESPGVCFVCLRFSQR